ncbi:Protein GRINL1A [Myotis davidii]|uniref:DNA-directed RNA polymerase II subunit GRINL1A n=1 Tax=Myotis davidii TaxID=225400 RepID=L5LNI8_MYODS|nr:Protein GRINL1A [Myotis davidii]
MIWIWGKWRRPRVPPPPEAPLARTPPDSGKKIRDSVVKLRAAIAEREEVRGKSELFHPISLDCKPRQKAIAVDVDTDKAQNSEQILDTPSLVPGCSSVDNIASSNTASQQGLVHSSHKGRSAGKRGANHGGRAPPWSVAARHPSARRQPRSRSRSGHTEPAGAEGSQSPAARLLLPYALQVPSEQVPSFQQQRHRTFHTQASWCLPQPPVSGPAEDNSTSSDDLFIDRLQRITTADPDGQHSEENTRTETLTGLRSGTQKKPHYMEVLDMRAENPVPSPCKFKTNVLPSHQNASSSHQQRRGSPISSEERLRRDKQHLDDITAARLLPLPHLPAQLLSIE